MTRGEASLLMITRSDVPCPHTLLLPLGFPSRFPAPLFQAENNLFIEDYAQAIILKVLTYIAHLCPICYSRQDIGKIQEWRASRSIRSILLKYRLKAASKLRLGINLGT